MNNNSTLKILNVGLSNRIGFYEILKKQGAKIKFDNLKKRIMSWWDIIVKSCTLKPLKVSKEYYVKSTDEYPILFIIAALTKGVSSLMV